MSERLTRGRRFVVVTAAAAVALTLASCSGAERSDADDAPASADYVIAIPQDFQGIDRATYSSEAAKTIGDILRSRLLELEVDGSTPTSCLSEAPTRVKPDSPLVESWAFTEDGRGIDIVLRKGVKSAAGNTLTSADVEWTIERIKAIDAGAQTLWFTVGGFDRENTITVKSPTEFTLNLVKPTALAPYVLAGNTALILDATDAKANATADDPWATKYLTDHTANFGPWRLGSFSSQKLVFERNPHFTSERGNVERITVQTVADASSRIQLVQTGKVAETTGLDFTQLEQLSSSESVNLVRCGSPVRDWLGVNASDPVLGKPEVRQAISLALDREAIAAAVYRGFADPAKHGLASAFDVTEGAQHYAQNQERARELLAAAGVPEGWGFELSVSSAQPGPYAQNLAVLLQQQLAEVGIKVTIRNVPSAVQFRDEGRAKKMQAWLMGETPAFANAGYSAWLTAGCNGLQNYMGFCDQRIDELADQIMTGSNDSEKLTEELASLIDAAQPAIYLVDRATMIVRSECAMSVPSAAFTIDYTLAVSRCA